MALPLTIVNLTGSPISYLSGAVVVPASSSLAITNSVQKFSLLFDGQLRSDIFANNVTLSDGVNTYAVSNAEDFLAALAVALDIMTGGTDGTLIGNVSDRLKVDISGEDHNFGTVGIATLRTASQIGNATGAADFNAGATGAQTLRASANQGAPGTAANAWFEKITDGVSIAAVKPASTPAAATDPALVVALSPGSPLPSGTNTVGAVSFPNNSAAGALNGAGQTVSVNTVGCSTVQYSTLGTFVGQIVTEISYDNGANWFAQSTVDSDPDTNLMLQTWGDNAAGAFNNDPWIVPVAGTTNFRLRVVAYTSGSLAIQIVSTPAVSAIETPSNDRWQATSIAALNAVAGGATAGCSTCAISIVGTWVGTISFQATVDHINFFPVQAYNVSTNLNFLSTTSNGNFLVSCGGFHQVQAVFTSYSSGTAVVTVEASEGSNVNIVDQVTGNIPSGSPDAGAPIKMGGIYNSVLPTVASGSRVDLQLDANGRLLVSQLPSSSSKFSFGQLSTNTSTAFLPVEFTAYTEPTTNSAMTLVSASANDTSAGTGARTVMVTYLDQTGAGPFTTVFTMNGTTPVTAGVSNMCFVEKITVFTVGSTNSNVGILTLKTGGGATVGTIGATSNQTFWAHHYVPTGKTCYISGFSIGNNATAGGNGATFVLKSATPTVANTPEIQISDFIACAAITSTDTRTYLSPIQVSGPARVRAYVLPFANANTLQYAAFDFIDN